MKRILFTAIIIFGLVLSSVCLGYSGGTGTPADPYQIADKVDLLALAETPEDYNKSFILTADINMQGQIFTEAILGENDFTGVFDGDGHKVTHFTINGGSNDYLGLFGYVGSSGLVKSLGLESGSVSGNGNNIGGLMAENHGIIVNCYSTGSVNGAQYVGGLAGYNWGCITNCSSNGTVSGGSSVGGLAGYNMGNINNCYAMGTVNGYSGVGGLVGGCDGSIITNCYSTGTVSGSSSVGGLVGLNVGGSVFGSFWDTETSGQTTSGGGEGKTTSQMQDINTFLSAGWDFINEKASGTCNYWQMPAGSYPVLSVLNGYTPTQLPGSGTGEAPYIVTDANDLGTVWFWPRSHYALANDVNLSGITWSLSVVPAFSGVFDGNGFRINNLYVNGGDYLGLFGSTYSGSRIKNLGLENYTISGGAAIGGLVGRNEGNITSCYSMGTVSGVSNLGGLVGRNFYDGIISNCYSASSASGSGSVGGLVGDNYQGSITNCYATGTASGSEGSFYVGGLVGWNYGSITNCCATGAVSGTTCVGGLLGRNYFSGSSGISGCYFLIPGGPDNGLGQPLTDEQMKQQASFVDWDFVEIWNIGENQTYPFLRTYLPSDINKDNETNFYDLAILASHWLKQTSWNQ